MATAWYTSSNGYASIPSWPASTAVSVGTLCKGIAYDGTPRVWLCCTAGTTDTTEPSWAPARGATIVDNTAGWCEVTGMAAINGDALNTNYWPALTFIGAGMIVKNIAGGADTYFFALGGGASGSTEPAWNKTPGSITPDSGVTLPFNWICLGPMTNYTTPWVAASPYLELVDSWGAPGDTFYISNTHSQAVGTFRICGSGTLVDPCNYLCVVDTVAPPTTLAQTALITSTTGIIASVQNIASGPACNYLHGLNFESPIAFGLSETNAGVSVFEKCNFTYTGVAGNGNYSICPSGGSATLIDCNLTLEPTYASINVGGGFSSQVTMIGGSITPSSALAGPPFTVFVANGTSTEQLLLRDVDFSGMTGSLFLINPVYGIENTYNAVMENCKLDSAVTYVGGTIDSRRSLSLQAFNCSSNSNNFNLYTQNFMGSSEQNTTTVRTGGASNGVTPISWKLISTANSSFAFPFQSEVISIWNNITGGPMIINIEIAGTSTLTISDIWMDVEFLANGSYPIGTNVSTRGDLVTTTTPVTASVASWSGSPAVKQRLVTTLTTPQMKGIIRARISLAKPSTTVYVDPYITLTGGEPNRVQYMIPGFGSINETASGEFSYTFVG